MIATKEQIIKTIETLASFRFERAIKEFDKDLFIDNYIALSTYEKFKEKFSD